MSVYALSSHGITCHGGYTCIGHGLPQLSKRTCYTTTSLWIGCAPCSAQTWKWWAQVWAGAQAEARTDTDRGMNRTMGALAWPLTLVWTFGGLDLQTRNPSKVNPQCVLQLRPPGSSNTAVNPLLDSNFGIDVCNSIASHSADFTRNFAQRHPPTEPPRATLST